MSIFNDNLQNKYIFYRHLSLIIDINPGKPLKKTDPFIFKNDIYFVNYR
jgi:hypothetical protein